MKRKWWHDQIAYQIYPKSFYDSNGDGIGDVRGIIEKLDYLKDLGIGLLWLSPIYPSPLADEGYDISDYYGVDPRFGSLEDVGELIAEAKKRGIRIVMDLVVNHCSDEHEWFRKACEDPDGPYGSYFYIRHFQPDGAPPTNWRSFFGGSAWEALPGHPDRCYLHAFHKKQPDLNWENAALREEIFKNINWWLDKGLGGFRVDAIIYIKKPDVFHDYPADRSDGMSSFANILKDAHGIGDFLGEMQARAFAPHDAFSVGEVLGEKPGALAEFIGENGYFSSIFDFEEDNFGFSEKGWYDRTPCLPEDYKQCVFRAQKKAEGIGFFSNIIENHDEARGVSRYIPADELCADAKKALAAAYFFMRGIPFIYQGQELGMENLVFHSTDEFSDCSSFDQYETALAAGCTEEEALDSVSRYSRDNARTPMQWSGGHAAGFTTGTPWYRVNPNYTEVNAEKELKDPDSVLHFYRKMSELRRDLRYKDTFVYGEFIPWMPEQKNLLAYIRSGSPSVLVAVNMQKEAQTVACPETAATILLSNRPAEGPVSGTIRLAGWQAVVVEL